MPLFKECSKREQKEILINFKETMGTEALESLKKSGLLNNMWVEPDTLSPLLSLEPIYDKTIH